MLRIFNIRIILFLAVVFSLLFSLSLYAENINNDLYVIVNHKKVFLEVADTQEKRSEGLMFRESLDEDQGMIFLFDHPTQVYFWMKNMKIPLDILFISGDKIVNINKVAPVCNSENCPLYSSASKINLVLELKSGYCDKNKVKKGDTITISKKIQDEILTLEKE